MTPTVWPCPTPSGTTCPEQALCFEASGPVRLLIVPALFDEGNRMRRFTVEVQRRLARDHAMTSILPDLPGTNESRTWLGQQDVESWRRAMSGCRDHFAATHALGLRGGCLFTPEGLPRLHYAPARGAAILRQMLRARILAAREAGREETREGLLETAHSEGIALNGYDLGAAFVRAFEPCEPDPSVPILTQAALGGPGLWLRAEPSHDAAQADALARLIATTIAGGTT